MKTLSILFGRWANFCSKILGKEGTVIGGYWALKLDKNILKKIKYPQFVIGVTGSSGKSSTTELIAHILKKSGKSVVYNTNGSNAINGISSLIIENCSLSGKFKKDCLLMELDEKYMKEIFKFIPTTHLVITNITRDQPTRNGSPEIIFNEIKKSLNDNITLVLNADDPFVVKYSLTHKGKIVYYGLEKTKESSKNNLLNNVDAAYCPKCGNKLKYDFYHYGHIGSYKCPECDFKRPNLDFKAHNINLSDRKIFINKEEIILPSNFLYSVYFTTAAYALTSSIGIEKQKILNALNKEILKTKRLNIYDFDKRHWQMLASKNENNLSYRQSIDFIINEPGKKTVVLGFENVSRRYHENDISWIWDVDFEKFNNDSIDKILIIGRFKYDILTRFEYANISKEKLILIENLDDIINVLKTKTKGNIYSMVCFDMEIILKNLLKEEGEK